MWILFSVFVAIGLAIASNWLRSRHRPQFKLMPNCLMTRSPLVFVTGWRSPFYFLNYWNGIPTYLREHGYEVVELDLPWRNTSVRQQDLSHFLEAAKSQDLQFHFIFDGAGLHEAKCLKEWNHPAVKSITIATPEYFGLGRPRHENLGQRFSPEALCTRFAVTCHRIYLPHDTEFHPIISGIPYAAPYFTAEKEFLRLAISLAEKEIKLAHNVTHDIHQ